MHIIYNLVVNNDFCQDIKIFVQFFILKHNLFKALYISYINSIFISIYYLNDLFII